MGGIEPTSRHRKLSVITTFQDDCVLPKTTQRLFVTMVH